MLMPTGRPRLPIPNYNLRSGAARMAADEEQLKPPPSFPGGSAPVVPTTNIKTAPQTGSSAPPTYSAASAPSPSSGGGRSYAASVAPSAPSTAGVGAMSSSAAPQPQSAPRTPIAAPINSIAPSTPVAGRPANGADVDALREATQNALLQNKVHGDASAQTKAITDLEQAQVGQGQRDLNARLGASGFGTSGYLGASTENMRSSAARQAALDIASTQRQADNDARASLMQGIGATDAGRRLDMNETTFQNNLDIAGQLEHPGFIDANHDGKDDQSGITLPQHNSTADITPEGRQHAPLDTGYFSPVGSPQSPYAFEPGEEDRVKAAGWKAKQSMVNGRSVTVYQDPVSKSYFVSAPQGIWTVY